MNHRDDDGLTPLILAVKNKHRAFIKFMIKRFKHDIDINASTQKFGCALIIAIKFDEYDIASMLIQEERVNCMCASPDDGNTPLHILFSKFHENINKATNLCR